MITVDNVTRKFGDFTAVDKVSFSLSSGEIVGLLGHNGAGKTTLMKMMTGFLEPTAGSITIDGLTLGGLEEQAGHRRAIQKKIGYLPENCPVWPEMTVVGYLDYCAALHGVPEQKRPALIRDAIIRTALQDKMTAKISTLSRGYRQRTGVAQAILHTPSILILDEPTNGLDPTQIQHMRRLITGLAQKATVIISTHILQEVQAICDRVVIIRDGTVALDSRLDTLEKNSRLLVRTSASSDLSRPLFQEMDAIQAVTQVAEGTLALELTRETLSSDEVAAMVAQAVQEQGWKLYDMHFDTGSLETVFADISA